jgi:hypothetical protein
VIAGFAVDISGAIIRRFNNLFPSPHPSMSQFIDAVRAISDDYVLVWNRIKQGNYPPPVHEPPTIHEIPSDYDDFLVAK